MKQLPIGIQDFPKLRNEGFLYVDKTEQLYRLMQLGGYLFFARPRRFGKSLTVSTLNEIYTGNKRLFEGLWIADKIDWQPRPVIRIDMSKLDYKAEPLLVTLDKRMIQIAESYNIDVSQIDTPKQKFIFLLETFAKQGRKAAVLIDEYDAPIIDCLGDEAKIQEHISTLKPFYRTLKDSDAEIHAAFITGVSKFGKVSIFSDLNNLQDVSMYEATRTLCGYTQTEVEICFPDYIDRAAQRNKLTREETLRLIKYWYNGYTWDGNEEYSVYNPFSLLNFFAEPEFKGFWFETGTPTMLTKLIKQKHITTYQLEKFTAGSLALSSADVQNIEPIGMLFQTGYLTVRHKELEDGIPTYTLGYPNEEVRQAFSKFLLGEYMDTAGSSMDASVVPPMKAALNAYDFPEFFRLIKGIFASIPYHITGEKESYFHSVMHVVLTITGWQVYSEVATNRGRMDTVLENKHTVYIFEFKIAESAAAALAQIRANGYPERYAKAGKKLVLIGVSYSLRSKNVREWKVEEMNE